MAELKVCCAPDCGKPVRKSGAKHCATHESRWYKYGSFDLPPRFDALGPKIIGQRYGRLIGVRETESVMGSNQKLRRFLFQCDCGTRKIICPRSVRAGLIVSCGCKARENARIAGKNSATHGESKTKPYFAYKAMVNRCYNPSVEKYKSYGARGITVCDRWLGEGGYENYTADMGKKPSPAHSLDRIDVNGPYSPENCRWATRSEQANNKTTSRIVEYQGRSQTLAQWEAETGIRAINIHLRLKQGWSVEKALTTPTRKMEDKPSLSEGGYKSNSSEYGIWCSMKTRCRSQNDRAFPEYGGRGIGMCDEWYDSFDAFYADVGPRPKGLSLDRIDNDKGYCKENCRWATRTVQNNNKRMPRTKATRNG